MLKRIREAVGAANQAVQTADQVSGNAPVQRQALLVLDAQNDAAAWIKASFLEKTAAAKVGPLFILGPMTETEFGQLDNLCEYLPSPEHLFRTTGDRPDVIQQYLQNRLIHILSKWRVEVCYWRGETAADFVAALSHPLAGAHRRIDFQRL